MSIYIGDKEITMAYLGGLPIVQTIQRIPFSFSGSYVTGGLIHYFDANLDADAFYWDDQVSNITGSVATSSVFLNSNENVSYYDFVSGSAPGSFEIFFSFTPPLAVSSDRTILTWIKPKKTATTNQNNQVIEAMGKVGPPEDVSGLILQNGKYAVATGGNPKGFTYPTTGSLGNYPLNEWQMAGYTFNDATSTITLYRNLTSSSFSGNLSYDTEGEGNGWLVGDMGAKLMYSGSLGIYMMYNRVLTPQEIQQNYDYFNQGYN